jgi:hypothetical protein
VWHYYTRKKSKRQWDDDSNWAKRDAESIKRNRMLFGIEKSPAGFDFGRYGFGKVRTLRDYERYAGILFSRKAVQRETLEGKYPPNSTFNYPEHQWLKSFFVSNHYCIQVDRKLLKEKDYDFWVVAFNSEDHLPVLRSDAEKDEIATITSGTNSTYEIWREVYPFKKPKYWVLWPHSLSKGWCERITGNI